MVNQLALERNCVKTTYQNVYHNMSLMQEIYFENQVEKLNRIRNGTMIHRIFINMQSIVINMERHVSRDLFVVNITGVIAYCSISFRVFFDYFIILKRVFNIRKRSL